MIPGSVWLAAIGHPCWRRGPGAAGGAVVLVVEGEGVGEPERVLHRGRVLDAHEVVVPDAV